MAGFAIKIQKETIILKIKHHLLNYNMVATEKIFGC